MTFDEANEVGKRGELITKKLLESLDWNIIDCSAHGFFQQAGIDIVIAKNERVLTIDVKNDTHDPVNFFIERVANVDTGRVGWGWTSKADYWIYSFEKTNDLFFLKPDAIRDTIAENDFRHVIAPTKKNGVVVYYTEGVLLPINKAPIVVKYNTTIDGTFVINSMS